MGATKVIAVMGVTGVGKSSFIKLVTGDESIEIGESLVSQTATVNTYKFRHKDRTIILVDTPGFDDTHKNDTDVLKQLATWFEETYKSGTKLSGIIYLHRITDDRMRGSSLRSMRMFRQLCGESFYSNLMLGTTCWSLVSEDVGSDREKELMTNGKFWKGLIGKGAQFVRIPDDGYEAKELVYDLARLEPASLQIQKEMVDGHVQFSALSATQALEDELAALQAEQEKQKQLLQAEHQRKLEEQKQKEQRLRLEMEQRKRHALLELQLKAEHAAIAESRAKFTEGLQNNKYMAKLYPFAIAASTTCDNCCRWVGHHQYYVCSSCQDGNFVLCGECYQSKAAFCYDESHHASMKMVSTYDGPPSCRHINFPIQAGAHFACYRCAKNLEGVFVHCCLCLNDSFNMCLECLTGLGTCKKSWSLSGHRLYPMIRRCRYKLPEDLQPDLNRQNSSDGNLDDTSQRLFDQAKKFKDEMQWNEAKDAYLQIVSRREKEHGIEDELLRNSHYELGVVFHKLDELNKAAENFEKALSGEEKSYGPHDNRTLFTAFELGKVYRKQNKDDLATTMYTRAIGREAKCGISDVAVRYSRYELGILCGERGELAEAKSFFELALKGEEADPGVSLEGVLLTVSRLADVQRKLGHFGDSKKGYTRVLKGREKLFGVDDKQTLDTCYNLGLLYTDSQNYVGAEANFSRAISGYEKLLGMNDSEVLEAMDKKIKVLLLAMRYEPAAELCHIALQRRKETLSPQHADIEANENQLREVTEKLRSVKARADSFAATPITVTVEPQTRRQSSQISPASPSPSHQSFQTGPRFSVDSRQSIHAGQGLNASFTPLMNALPQVSFGQPQQIMAWDQRYLQMVLHGQLGLETRDPEGKTAFLFALHQNNDHSAVDLLNRGANIFAVDLSGRTGLHLAMSCGNVFLTTMLLERGVSAMARDVHGALPLHSAAFSGQNYSMSTLLAHSGPAMDRFDIEAADRNGHTALQLASLLGHQVAVQVLMSHGASYTTMNGLRGMNAAHIAAENGQTEVLRIFTQWGCKLDSPSNTGMTALHYAAANGQSFAIEFLIDSGANVEAKVPSTGWTPLFHSTYNGHAAASQALMRKGANAYAVEATGFPLLHTLAINDKAAGLRTLFEAGVGIETMDRIGNTPILYAVRAKTSEALYTLLEVRANPAAVDTQTGGSALHYAANNGLVAAVQMLVAFGASVHAANAAGLSPLHLAVISGHGESVRLLLAAGANEGTVTREGYSAIQLATMYNQSAIIPILSPNL